MYERLEARQAFFDAGRVRAAIVLVGIGRLGCFMPRVILMDRCPVNGRWTRWSLCSRRVPLRRLSRGWLPPGDLPAAYEGLVAALEASGVPVPSSQWASRQEAEDEWGLMPGTEGEPGFGGLRRCDSTEDLQFGSAARGLAVLAGVAAVSTTAPRSQAEVRFAKDGTGAVETVYLRGYSGVKILGRWYDKGLESGSAPRGGRVRAEDCQGRLKIDSVAPGWVQANVATLS